MTDITANFFKAGPIYTDRRHGYQAPETVTEFKAKIITTFPDSDKRIAFGFVRQGDGDEWVPTGLEERHWAEREWKVKS